MIEPYFETELGKLYHGDCLETLRRLPDESVDCIMTSPPYWALRDYGVEGQLGLEPTFQEYIEKLIQIFDEIKRVLKKTGTCWVNIGDTYSHSGGSGADQTKHIQFGKVQNVNKYSAGTVPHIAKDLPGKCLCQIPERFSIAMTDRGWIKRNTIIWFKSNCMPSSADDRFTVDFEYLYFFTKNKQYYFEQQLEKTLTKDNSIRDRDNTKLNNTPGRTRMAGLKVNNYGFKNKRCVWKIPTKSYPEAHFAVYPEQLCYTPIKAGCPKDGVVLDPFVGAGTTLLVAEKLDRKNIGIEISKEYCDIAVDRIKKETAQYKMNFI